MEIAYIYPVTNIVDPLLYDFKIEGVLITLYSSISSHKQVKGIAITFSY